MRIERKGLNWLSEQFFHETKNELARIFPRKDAVRWLNASPAAA